MATLQSIYQVLIKTLSDDSALDSLKKKTDSLGKGVTVPVAIGGINKANTEAKQFSESLDTVKDKASSLGKTFAGFAIGALFAGGLTAALQAGVDFDKGLHDLSAITGVTGAALDDLGNKARESALKFGGDAATNITVYKGILSRLGPDLAQTPAVLAQISNAIQTLSKASGDDTATSMDAVTTALLQFGNEAATFKNQGDAASNFINVMAAGAKEGAAEIPQVSEALKVAGVAASDAKVSFVETNAAIQALAQGGKVGAEAGTALRNVLSKLGQGRFLPPETQLELKAAGVDINTLADTTIPLTDRLRELAKIQNDAALKTKFFGEENAAAGSILLRTVDFQDQLQQKITGTNVATEQAQVNSQSFAAELERLKAVGADVGISLFKAVQPVLEFMVKGAEGFTTFFGGIINFVGQSKPLLAALGIGLTVVVGLLAVGAVKNFFGGFVSGAIQSALAIVQKIIPSLITQTVTTAGAETAQLGLNAAMLLTPWGIAIAAVAALGAGIAIYLASQKSLKERTEDLNKELEHFNEENQKAKSIEDTAKKTRKLADEYDRLKKSDLPADQKKLAEVTKELDTATEGVASRVDIYGNAVAVSTEQVRAFADEQDNLARAMRETAIADLDDKVGSLLDNFGKAREQQKELRDDINTGSAANLSVFQLAAQVLHVGGDIGKDMKENVKDTRAELGKLSGEATTAKEAIIKALSGEEKQTGTLFTLDALIKKFGTTKEVATEILGELARKRSETEAVTKTQEEAQIARKAKLKTHEEDLLQLAKSAADEATKSVEIEDRMAKLKSGQKFTTQDELRLSELALQNLKSQIDSRNLLGNKKYAVKAQLLLDEASIKTLELKAKIVVDLAKLADDIQKGKDDIEKKQIELGIRPKGDLTKLLNAQIKRTEDEIAAVSLNLKLDDAGNIIGVLDETTGEALKKREELQLKLLGLNGELTKNEAEVQAKIRELRIGNIQGDTARELAALEEKHNKELQDAGILGQADADLTKQQLEIKKELNLRYEL
ncbi:MAG: phage tail tape measure protein, partial [Ignavibacteriota bacterium]